MRLDSIFVIVLSNCFTSGKAVSDICIAREAIPGAML